MNTWIATACGLAMTRERWPRLHIPPVLPTHLKQSVGDLPQ